ncbi:MAG: metallophosphoesterase [Sulfuritalea sp.]|nr:metallophosphoesterase [Sulfuritalea sp.]MDP1982290.1 metallophosphoesterase [Sulfuritalea sp.]
MTSSTLHAEAHPDTGGEGRPPARDRSAAIRMPPLRFILIASGLIGLLHAYIGLRLLPALDTGGAGTVIGILVLAAGTLLIPFGLLARALPGRLHEGVAGALTWTGLIAGGFASSLLVLTVVRDLLLLPALAVLHTDGFQALASVSAWAVPSIAVAVTAIGLFNARRRPQVVEVDVPLRDLPAALHGFTITQISDVHVGPTIKRGFLERIVDQVNRLESDLIAITGDLVDGSVAELAPHVAPLTRLRARHGSFFVSGNHEYYSGAGAWMKELSRLGLIVLQNQHVVLHHQGQPLVLAGVTDYSAHHFDERQRSDPMAALAGAPPDAALKILLAHQPRSALAAEAAGFHLQLSGHTHGGQFLPWNFFVRLQQPFTAGLHRLNDLWVYTSRGTGYWGPPKRLGAPAEITRLRLIATSSC